MSLSSQFNDDEDEDQEDNAQTADLSDNEGDEEQEVPNGSISQGKNREDPYVYVTKYIFTTTN